MKRDLALGLSRIGDWGLFAPVLVFLLGIAVPPLALLGQLMLIPCVIVLLTMSVGIAEPGRIERCEWPPVILLAACNLVGTPLLIRALMLFFGLSESGAGWFLWRLAQRLVVRRWSRRCCACRCGHCCWRNSWDSSPCR